MTPLEIIEQFDKLTLDKTNEAETRLKIINDVIYDVLGWTHADIKVEERVSEDGSTTWADYVIRTGMTAIVIEAKKVGVAFDNVPTERRVQLTRKLVAGQMGEAIIQARDYARKLGVPFAVVTNGDSWIVFPATRVDQVEFSSSSAIVFSNLKSALQDDYVEFNELLSRKAVIAGSLENELLGRIENQIAERRLNRYFTTSFSRISRHSLFSLIEDAVTTSFTEDIVNSNSSLLEKCYVQTPERIRFDGRIKMQIAKRDSVTARASIRPLRERIDVVGDIISAAASRAKPIAILVLGSVGSGKTTFLEHTRRVGARDVLQPDVSKPYPHWIYVDFRPYSTSESSYAYLIEALKSHIGSDPFLSHYDRCLKHAYKDEIDALFKGPLFLLSNDEGERKRQITSLMMSDYQNGAPYVEKILRYASARSPVFIVVDNVDQFEDEKIQSKIFADAMAVAQKVGANLICAMREATYVRHRNTPTFDAFDFDPIAIDPPQVQSVLSKRFFLAGQLLEGKSASFIAENGATMHVSDLSSIIDLVQASVLGTEIGSLIEVLATSDIRLALRMTREFLQSGWTASGKALRIYQTTGKYVMPRHEALRAIMLGNQQVYSEEFSVLGNPFDSRLSKTEAQLLRLFVLSAAVTLSSEKSFRYLEGNEIRRCLREIGFGDDITQKVLSDLCGMRFLFTTSHSEATFESNYVPSRLGGYIIRHFLSDMMYLENVMMDTFIPKEKSWDLLQKLTASVYAERNTIKRIETRRVRCAAFYQCMKELYTPLHEESMRRGLPREWCVNPLESSENQFTSNLNYVSRSAERNYGMGISQETKN